MPGALTKKGEPWTAGLRNCLLTPGALHRPYIAREHRGRRRVGAKAREVATTTVRIRPAREWIS